eukprot:1928850-Prorocentrum_lima.AAC.1
MTSSLVGSEMCIRDSCSSARARREAYGGALGSDEGPGSVFGVSSLFAAAVKSATSAVPFVSCADSRTAIAT